MKRPTVIILALLICSAIKADQMHLSDSLPCQYLGSLYYGENVGYQLNFETENLNLLKHQGEGKLLTVTLVVPRKGNKSNSLPEGEFTLGSCDSVTLNTLDYYQSGVRYYGIYNYPFVKPDINTAFLQCKVTIAKQKKGKYEIHIKYELNNGDTGEYSYTGKIRNVKHDERAKFVFLPDTPRIKNWQLTDAKIEVIDETHYSSRHAELRFLCADEIYGVVDIYLPLDSVNGHYVIRYGCEPGSCQKSQGGYDRHGYFNIHNTGIEEDSSGFIYYPETGYVDITDGKMFFEFTTIDGSIVRGVFKGEIKQ